MHIHKEGYPLSHFANTKPFSVFFKMLDKQNGLSAKHENQSLDKNKKESKYLEHTTEPCIPDWAKNVRLVTFQSKKLEKNKHNDYEYLLEFTTTREVKILLNEPKGTIAIFGYNTNTPMKKLTTQNDQEKPQSLSHLSLRLILDGSNGAVKQTFINGDLRFQLPRGLVRPVKMRNGYWVEATPKALIVKLGASIINLTRGSRPKLSQPLYLPSNTIVRIGKMPLVVRLGKIDLGGTASHPKLQFLDTQLVYSTT